MEATSEQITTAATALAQFVGARSTDDYITSCAREAIALVASYVNPDNVPADILSRAILETGADLYHRRATRNGIAGFEDSDLAASPVRINRDPLAAARPLLARYAGVPIA